MARVLVFGVLVALWTVLCIAVLVVVGAGGVAAGLLGPMLTTMDPQRLADLVAIYGGLATALVWLAGAIALILIARAMRPAPAPAGSDGPQR
jgi:hypothetical protein